MKRCVETRHLWQPGKMLLREADDRTGRRNMQRRERPSQPRVAAKPRSSMTQCRRSFGPPCTMRCPTAAGCRQFASRRGALRYGRPLRACPEAAWSPRASVSVRDAPTRYNPNLSEEEPLFSARTCILFGGEHYAHSADVHRRSQFQRQSRTSGMSSPCSQM